MKMTLTTWIAYISTVGFFLGVILLGFYLTAPRASAHDLPAEISVPKLSESIKDVENTPHYHIGAAGERSAWQIKQEVWEAHTQKPFWWASSPDSKHVSETKRVVVMHILWIRRRLQTLQLQDTPRSIALVYKAGYGRCLAHKPRRADTDYAKRVENVYFDTP